MRGDVAFGDARQLRHVLAQLVRAQRAVKAEGERIGVAQRVIERLGGLARQRAARGVGDRAGDHNGQLDAERVELRLHGEDRGLGVKRIEDRFDKNEIRAAFDQRARGFAVSLHQLIKSNITEGRVVNIRRNRRCTVSRP